MPRNKPHHHSSGSNQPRSVQISKALSKLLRHQALAEGIPVDSHGYVRVDRVLGWRGLRGMRGMRGSGKEEVGVGVGMEDVVECVGESEKMRFGLRYGAKNEGEVEEGVVVRAGGEGEEDVSGEGVRGNVGPHAEGHDGKKDDESESKGKVDAEMERKQKVNGDSPQNTNTPTDDGAAEVNNDHPSIAEEQISNETQRAITVFTSGQDTNPKHFYIRANQGHSMKGVEAEHLLSPITLEDEAGIPETVVHGTFYGGWEGILRSRGLKRMGRNHVHFSTGPGVEDVLKPVGGEGGGLGVEGEMDKDKNKDRGKKGRLSALMDESKVVSGMRRDAQVLIYIDLRKALSEEKEMKWWRSENGVVLTEGRGEEGVVGMEYWTKVVEVKEGLGVLWEDGGVVKELPEHLKGKPVPMGKGRGGRGGGGIGVGRGRMTGGNRRRGGKVEGEEMLDVDS